MKIDVMHIPRIEIHQISPTDSKVRQLIQQLNTYQIDLYGIDQCTLETPEEMMTNGAYMLGAFVRTELVAMGAIKIKEEYGELKRMYVMESQRGKGIASKILVKLEQFSISKGIFKIRLETGNLHFHAMAMYEKQGYQRIGIYGDYKPNNISVFFEKSWKK